MKGKVSLLIVTSSIGIGRVRFNSMTLHLVGAKSININLDTDDIEKPAEDIFQMFFNKEYLVENICELRLFHMTYASQRAECNVHDGNVVVKKIEEILLKKITVFKESLKE